MNKIVIISTCSDCPHVAFIEQPGPSNFRVYVGCSKIKKSFDYEAMNAVPIPIPNWCPLLNAEGAADKKDIA